jgi:predicted DNA binding CopG/RHH family protein
MKKEYDFAKMKGIKNPYAKLLKKQITIRIATDTIQYFKTMSSQTGIAYQNLIDLYLSDCALKHRKLRLGFK